eukprot:50303-Pleurochrysis_carterae.AAC.2
MPPTFKQRGKTLGDSRMQSGVRVRICSTATKKETYMLAQNISKFCYPRPAPSAHNVQLRSFAFERSSQRGGAWSVLLEAAEDCSKMGKEGEKRQRCTEVVPRSEAERRGVEASQVASWLIRAAVVKGHRPVDARDACERANCRDLARRSELASRTIFAASSDRGTALFAAQQQQSARRSVPTSVLRAGMACGAAASVLRPRQTFVDVQSRSCARNWTEREVSRLS